MLHWLTTRLTRSIDVPKSRRLYIYPTIYTSSFPLPSKLIRVTTKCSPPSFSSSAPKPFIHPSACPSAFLTNRSPNRSSVRPSVCLSFSLNFSFSYRFNPKSKSESHSHWYIHQRSEFCNVTVGWRQRGKESRMSVSEWESLYLDIFPLTLVISLMRVEQIEWLRANKVDRLNEASGMKQSE